MKKNIKTAVIGVGNMGRNHARIYSAISYLVAVADTNPQIGKSIADNLGANFYTDYKEMLDKEIIEAVSVAVPTKLHKEITLECLKRKIPVLVEKPLADTLDNAEAIAKTANKVGVPLMVGHIERFNPVVIKLKNLLDQGKFGAIVSLLAIRIGNIPPKTADSDVVIDLAIHDIDIFNFLLGELPLTWITKTSKLAQYNNIADSASLLLEYKTALGMVQTNWITPTKMRKLYITGTKAFAEVDYINQELVFYDQFAREKRERSFREFISRYTPKKKETIIEKKEPLKEELISFLECVLNNKVINYRYAIDAMKIALTCRHSYGS